MLDYINERERVHILTIEDPSNTCSFDKKAVINQPKSASTSAIGYGPSSTPCVKIPDVILVGEMRDRDTFEAGMHAAETGHLVFGHDSRFHCPQHHRTYSPIFSRQICTMPCDRAWRSI